MLEGDNKGNTKGCQEGGGEDRKSGKGKMGRWVGGLRRTRGRGFKEDEGQGVEGKDKRRRININKEIKYEKGVIQRWE